MQQQLGDIAEVVNELVYVIEPLADMRSPECILVVVRLNRGISGGPRLQCRVSRGQSFVQELICPQCNGKLRTASEDTHACAFEQSLRAFCLDDVGCAVA